MSPVSPGRAPRSGWSCPAGSAGKRSPRKPMTFLRLPAHHSRPSTPDSQLSRPSTRRGCYGEAIAAQLGGYPAGWGRTVRLRSIRGVRCVHPHPGGGHCHPMRQSRGWCCVSERLTGSCGSLPDLGSVGIDVWTWLEPRARREPVRPESRSEPAPPHRGSQDASSPLRDATRPSWR